jgi:hypothetical protein
MGLRNEENPLGSGGALSQRNDQSSSGFLTNEIGAESSPGRQNRLHPIGDLLPREKAIHAGPRASHHTPCVDGGPPRLPLP